MPLLYKPDNNINTKPNTQSNLSAVPYAGPVTTAARTLVGPEGEKEEQLPSARPPTLFLILYIIMKN